MDIVLTYFSQTGQTLRVAEAMAEALQERGHALRVLPMRDAKPGDIAGCDVLGVGAPSFESQAPAPVKAWMRAWPALYGKPSFVFATAGGAPGNTLYELTSALRAKGGAVKGGFMCRGMVHHPAPCLIGRMPQRPDALDLSRARDFALAVERHISGGCAGDLPESRPDALKPTVGFYQLVGLIAKPFLLRIILPKPRLDRERCTQCGTCETECPSGSIVLDPYPVINGRCIRCYRCSNVCPQNALSESWWYGNPLIFSLYNPAFIRLFGDIEPGEKIY